VRQGKALRATRLGSALIASLPEAVGRPERTALWEQRLTAIAEEASAPAPFLDSLISDLHALLGAADAGRLRQALHNAEGEEAKAPQRASRRRGTGRATSKGSKRRAPRRRKEGS